MSWTRTAATFLVIASVAACSDVGSEPSIEQTSLTTHTTIAPTTTTPTSMTELTEEDISAMVSYRRLLAEIGPEVWPGWGEPVPPLLQLGLEAEYLVGHPDPPEGFTPTGLTADQIEVWSAPPGTVTPGPFATTWDVDGVWSAMIPVRDLFEQTVDEVLGEGTVDWTDAAYLRGLVHEAFHAYQLATDDALPDFGGSDDDRAMAALEDVSLEAAYALEASALRDAIVAETLSEAREHVADFLDLRAERWSSYDADMIALEKTMEWAEGAARYADVAVLTADRSGIDLPPLTELPTGPELRDEYLEDLASSVSREDGIRGWWQALGSAQLFALDRLSVRWQTQVLEDQRAIDQMLAGAVEVPPALEEFEVIEATIDGRAMRLAVAATPDEWAAGLTGVDLLDPLDGMLFWFPEDVAGQGFTMRGAVIPLDIAFFSAVGELVSVETMPLCEADPCPTYGPDESFRFAVEAEGGAFSGLAPGATLELPEASP